MNGYLGHRSLACWLLCGILCGTGVSGHAEATKAELDALQGFVHSTKHGQEHQPQGSYFLLVIADSPMAEASLGRRLQRQLGTQLQQAGYTNRARRMERADVVLVARLGVRADTPSVDAILAGEVDPDALLPTGVRYLQLEAYDLQEYIQFLRQHQGAAADINVQFQAWRTTVESRGLLADYAAVLPALLQVASYKMGTEMAAIERFVLSADGLQLDPV